MQTVVLIMRRRPVAQGLIQKLRGDPNFSLYFEYSYTNAEATIRTHNAGIALIEVAETAGHDTAHCLALCARLQETAPQCKLLLLCPETNPMAVARAVAAKRRGLIDDFIFYDSTTDYLASKILSM